MSDQDFAFYAEPTDINRLFVGLGETPRGDRVAIGLDGTRDAAELDLSEALALLSALTGCIEAMVGGDAA